MKPRDTDPQVRRALVALDRSPAPGTTGATYQLAGAPQPLTISVPATDEVWVTVGCRSVRFTAAEAVEIAQDLIDAAEEATVG